ncbi:MAG: hypothetical protein GY867_01105 [bacterium]|nr:hypothetical protein [bacterium]
MGLAFIDRSLRTFGVVLMIFLPFGLYYLGTFPALAIFSGGIWGMLNLLFLSKLVKVSLRPEGADRNKTLLIAVFKFPVLYAAGYFLLMIPQFEPLMLVIGFTGMLGIIVLRALSRVIIQVNDQPHKSSNAQGMA